MSQKTGRGLNRRLAGSSSVCFPRWTRAGAQKQQTKVYGIKTWYSQTYQAQHDTLEIKPLIMTLCALAVMIHPELNDRPLFDTLWTASP